MESTLEHTHPKTGPKSYSVGLKKKHRKVIFWRFAFPNLLRFVGSFSQPLMRIAGGEALFSASFSIT